MQHSQSLDIEPFIDIVLFHKQQHLRHILTDWIKEGHSVNQTICQALLTAQQLTQQVTGKQSRGVGVSLNNISSVREIRLVSGTKLCPILYFTA